MRRYHCGCFGKKLVQCAVSRDGERHLYKVVAGICGKLFLLFILL